MTAIGTAKRQSTTRAMTNGTNATPLIDNGQHVLHRILRVEARQAGKRQNREHQYAHARAEVAAVNRDEKLQRQLPRRMARMSALDRRVNQGLTAKTAVANSSSHGIIRSNSAGGVTRSSTAPISDADDADGDHRQQQRRDARRPLLCNRARCRSYRPTSRRCWSRWPKSPERPQKSAPETKENCRRRQRCSSRRRKTPPRPAARRVGSSTRAVEPTAPRARAWSRGKRGERS